MKDDDDKVARPSQATARSPRKTVSLAERISARANGNVWGTRLWDRWGRAGPLVDPPRAAPQPAAGPRTPRTDEPTPLPRPAVARPAAVAPAPAVVPDPRPLPPVATPAAPPLPPPVARESQGGRLRVTRAPPRLAPPQQPAPDPAAIRAQKLADRGSEPAKPAVLPSRGIDQVHDLLAGLRDAEQSFRTSVAEIEAAKAAGQPRPSRTTTASTGLDDVFGSGNETRTRLGKRNPPKA